MEAIERAVLQHLADLTAKTDAVHKNLLEHDKRQVELNRKLDNIHTAIAGNEALKIKGHGERINELEKKAKTAERARWLNRGVITAAAFIEAKFKILTDIFSSH